MGAPPACMYATLFFPHERRLIERYSPSFLYYKRYINDIFIVVDTANTGFDTVRFQQELLFGHLRWTVSTLTTCCTFLDVSLTKEQSAPTPRIVTSLVTKKPMNLHAFIPPLSCHPSSTLKSMVFGLMFRICHLTDTKETQRLQNSVYFDRFTAEAIPAPS
jgi:hypothetical protein